MALKIFERLFGSNGRVTYQHVPVSDLCRMANECKARELAFNACVNLIAASLARCEFRTYLNGAEVFGENYWAFNFSPNQNENSTLFWHRVVYNLYSTNEALIIPGRRVKSTQSWHVADCWEPPADDPERETQYKSVQVGSGNWKKNFRESDVFHLQLSAVNVKPVLDEISRSYEKLIQAAMRNYTFSNGQHLKVHVSQMAQGDENWAKSFQEMMDEQVKPFFENPDAILPETDGYDYKDMGSHAATSRDASGIRQMYEDVFSYTANAFGIPPVLLLGKVEETKDAVARYMTNCVDPLADQISEEITRKSYGFEGWKNGSYIRVDTSSINHFDLFANAPNIEKLIGCGYSYNDVQRAANLPTIDAPWANEHFLTKNIGQIQELMKGENANG